MSFLDAWKSYSIMITGLLGVIGLLSDYKDKETGQVTVWGKAALAGIVVSSLFGVLAERMEFSKEENARVETAKKTLALAQNTDTAVHDLKRLLYPIKSPIINVFYEIKCNNFVFGNFCAHTGFDFVHRSFPLSRITSIPDEFMVATFVYVFKDESSAQKFVELDIPDLHEDAVLGYEFYATKHESEHGIQHASMKIVPPIDGSMPDLILTSRSPKATNHSPSIVSLRDLMGKTVVVANPASMENYLYFDFFAISSGDEIIGVSRDANCKSKRGKIVTYSICQFADNVKDDFFFGQIAEQ